MTEHESNESDNTDDLLSGTGEGDGSTFTATATETTVASLENPAIADAIAATAEKPKRRGRRTNAEIAADKAKAAEAKNGNGSNGVGGNGHALNGELIVRPLDKFSVIESIDSTVASFSSDPAHADLTWIIASISEWIPAVSYRGIFRAIAQTHGEVGIYYALQIICPHVRREKRSGMAVAASMSAASARAMGKGIDQSESANGDVTQRIGTQVLANRYAGLGSAEVMEIMREPVI